jgi:hypothetical protein
LREIKIVIVGGFDMGNSAFIAAHGDTRLQPRCAQIVYSRLRADGLPAPVDRQDTTGENQKHPPRSLT